MHLTHLVTYGVRAAPDRRKKVNIRMRQIYVVVCGGKMAALGDTSALGVNGLIQQFTAITGKRIFSSGFALSTMFGLSSAESSAVLQPRRGQEDGP